VACAEEGSRRGEQGRSREKATRGSRPSRRWSGGGSTATAARCSAPAAEEAGGLGMAILPAGTRPVGYGFGHENLPAGSTRTRPEFNSGRARVSLLTRG
jgi:hypothetical protein